MQGISIRHILTLFFLCFFVLNNQTEAAKKHHRRRPASDTPSMASQDSAYLQRILYLEDQRISKDKFLIACLSHPSRRVVTAALIALGRIGDTSALDEMARFISGR